MDDIEKQIGEDYRRFGIDGTEVAPGEYYIAILLKRLVDVVEKQTRAIHQLGEDLLTK